MRLPDPRSLSPADRRKVAWAAHESWDIAPWPVLRHWNSQVSLRRHQRTGSAWMYLAMETLLADTVGSGKTFCTAAMLAMCAENGELGYDNRAVVVCGAAAVGQWVTELNRCLTSIPVVAASGSPRERTAAYLSPWQVAVVSGSSLIPTRGSDGRAGRTGDVATLLEFPVGILVYDDLDPLRNRKTATARSVRRLAAECSRVHGLHGTPLQKRLAELYCALEPVGSEDIFGTLEEFKERYVAQERFTIWVPVRKAFPSEKTAWARKQGFDSWPELTRQAAADREAGRTTRARGLVADVEAGRKRLQRVLWKDNGVNTDRLPEFQRLSAPLVLRRIAADLDDVEMPEVQAAPLWLDLLPEQRRRYTELRTGLLRRLRNGEEEITHAQAAAAWTRGAQICSGLAALDDGPGADISVKLDEVTRLLTGDLSEEKAVVFVYFRPNVAALSTRLQEEDIGHVLMWSEETSPKERDARLARFREDPDCRVLVGTTTIERSLNLQVARHLITADWVMNPARMEQIVGRVRRQGSAHATVFWHQLLCRDTQEESYLPLLRSEAAMANSVWNEDNAVFRALSPRQVVGMITGQSPAA